LAINDQGEEAEQIDALSEACPILSGRHCTLQRAEQMTEAVATE